MISWRQLTLSDNRLELPQSNGHCDYSPWRIFDLLTREDIRRMMSVHRAFYIHSHPFIWRTLMLCTLESRHRKQAKSILRNPTLGQHITELYLHPWVYVHKYKSNSKRRGSPRLVDTPTSIWAADPPIRTWFDLLSKIKWKHPIHSFEHFASSRKSLSTALAALPHLTRIRTLWVALFFRVHPSPEPYRKLCSNLHTSYLTSLAFTFFSTSTLQLISATMRTSGVTFPCLETLDLHFLLSASGGNHDLLFQENIKVISDAGRDTLKHLRLNFESRSDLHPIPILFSGLGTFRNLIHFDFTSFRSDDHISITRFIENHSSSLDRVNINGLISQLFQRLPTSEPMKLTSLGLGYQGGLMQVGPWSIGDPSLRPYANTLTTLAISPSWIDDEAPIAFSYDEVDRLVSSLYRSPGGALLQRLKIPVTYPCPEVFDLLSARLENLHTLEILNHPFVTHLGEETKQWIRDLGPASSTLIII